MIMGCGVVGSWREEGVWYTFFILKSIKIIFFLFLKFYFNYNRLKNLKTLKKINLK
jgi:hypothetical protein